MCFLCQIWNQWNGTMCLLSWTWVLRYKAEKKKKEQEKKSSCDLNAFRNMGLIKPTQKLLHYQYTTHIETAFQNFKQCECDQMKLHNKMAEPDGISFVIISLHYQHFSCYQHFSSLPTFQFTTNISVPRFSWQITATIPADHIIYILKWRGQ